MRCLYCGKELALLKRWTGGGEFCSDVHRQRYQEEYNQLALNRLLQAKPPAKPLEDAPAETEARPAAPAKPSVVAEPARQVTAPAAARPAPRIAAPPASEPVSMKASEAARPKPANREPPSQAAIRPAAAQVSAPPEPQPEAIVPVAPPVTYVAPRAPEEPAPAEAAGFFVEMPVAMVAEVAPLARPGMQFLDAVAAALPSHTFEPLISRQDTYQLGTAGLLTFQPSNRASNYTANGSRDRRLEVRDFVRTPPVVEIDLSPAGETGLETSSDAMDILIFPQPPQGLPPLWQEPSVGFSTAATELGDLARLSFTTTGFCDREETGDTAVALEEPPAEETPVDNVISEEPRVELPRESVVEAIASAPPIPEPAVTPVVTAAASPSVIPAPVVASVVASVVAAIVAPAVEPVVPREVEQAPPIPEPVTKPLPLTLHITAPGKGKTAQVFSSAPNAVAVQVPRSTSLPLRAAMTFGPAPVKEVEKPVEKKAPERPAPATLKNDVKNDVKTDAGSDAKIEPKRPFAAPAPVRPDPRLVSAKVRGTGPEVQDDKKPAPKAPAPELAKQAAKAESPAAPKPPARVDAKPDKKPELKENVKSKEEMKPPKAEPLPPASLAAPYAATSDLGLPRLNFQSSQGFLGQLPAIAKIGIVVVLLAGIGGLIAFSSKSGGAAVNPGAGTVIAGSSLPIGDAGWITDWGSDPGVRRTRQISILRSSQTLTDYRLEMEGQIETKAIGWVFRAADPKNFYVTKLEIVKPGLEPTVSLVRFAIINGEEQAHAQLPLPMKVRRDTMFKIRFDAVGSHFTTYVQDQKIDDWTDDRVKTGGVGLYNERGESSTLKGGMNVVPLILRK